MKRLSLRRIDELPAAIRRPGFDPRQAAVGIVHLGIGAFHRAHQAVYTDDVLALHGGDWRISGVSLRSDTVAQQLNPQDGLYALQVRGEAAIETRIVSAVADVLVAPHDPSAVIARLSDASTKIVSLTVTEKGYCHDPATGRLNESHPDVVADLENPEAPVSALGYLVAAIEQRRKRNVPPITVLCCDNLPDNGPLLRGLVIEHSALRDDALSSWIAGNVAFPATMVDRIVPATTAADRNAMAELLGVADEGLVVTEPFTQWVIEDNFSGPRPRWEDAGAELVADVAPYELAKLRLLNGCHSSIAYLGYLAGHRYVHQAIADQALWPFIAYLMIREISPTLTAPAGFDLEEYQRALLARFANPTLNHRTWQIAMDGSQKLPQRLLGTVRDRLSAGQGIDGICLAVAAWMRYVCGIDEQGERIDVSDPLSDRLAALAKNRMNEPRELVRALLSVTEVFDTDLPANTPFVDGVTAAMERLLRDGSRETVGRFSRY